MSKNDSGRKAQLLDAASMMRQMKSSAKMSADELLSLELRRVEARYPGWRARLQPWREAGGYIRVVFARELAKLELLVSPRRGDFVVMSASVSFLDYPLQLEPLSEKMKIEDCFLFRRDQLVTWLRGQAGSYSK